MEQRILKFIKEIKKEYGRKPQCYLVATLLTSNFKGEIWYDHNHCITMIDNDFYDKRGVVPIEVVEKGRYLPICMYGIEQQSALMTALVKSLT